MSPLVAQQQRFAVCLGRLLTTADLLDIGVTMGECYRSPEEAARLAAAGRGIRQSLHTQRLAVDLQLWRGGTWLRAGTEPEYARLGEHWKTLDPLARWGGDFRKPDPGHFSLTYGGRS